jgi:hypothetical protein
MLTLAFQAGNTGSNPVGDTAVCNNSEGLPGHSRASPGIPGAPASPPPHHGGEPPRNCAPVQRSVPRLGFLFCRTHRRGELWVNAFEMAREGVR